MSTGENAPYGVFVDNSYRMIFDMGKTKDDEYFWRAEGRSFVQYFFCGDSFADILRAYPRGSEHRYVGNTALDERQRRFHVRHEQHLYNENIYKNDPSAHYVRLRYRLLPYIYSYNYNAHITGAPMMRALVFEYPDDKNVFDIRDEYLFESELLVALVIEEKAAEREVYFQKGKWYDWDHGNCCEGGRSYTVYAPQNRRTLKSRFTMTAT